MWISMWGSGGIGICAAAGMQIPAAIAAGRSFFSIRFGIVNLRLMVEQRPCRERMEWRKGPRSGLRGRGRRGKEDRARGRSRHAERRGAEEREGRTDRPEQP